MASLNKVQFIGNAGADPEVRQFDNGNKVANVRIAVTERYTDRNNQTVENTEWIPLVFNGKLADIVAQYIKKGASIYVEGKWRTRKWTDQSGAEHFSTEVRVDNMQLLSPRQQAQAAPQQYPQAPPAPPQYPAQGAQVQQPQYAQAPQPPAPQYAAAPVPPAPQYAPQAPAPQPQYQQPPAPAAPTVDPIPDLPFDSAPWVRA